MNGCLHCRLSEKWLRNLRLVNHISNSTLKEPHNSKFLNYFRINFMMDDL